MELKKVTLTRGEEVKYVSAKHVDACKALGWKVDGTEGGETIEALEVLRVKADALGIQYHPRTGATKLAALIEEAENVE